MAGRGPTPKDHRVRTDRTPVLTEVVVPPGGPRELPGDLLEPGERWHPATLRWWQRWVDSPLAADLPAMDWCELEVCAVLHHQFMRTRSYSVAGELRLRVAKFGVANPDDRSRLKVKVVGPDPGSPLVPGVADMSSRRQLMRRADGA